MPVPTGRARARLLTALLAAAPLAVVGCGSSSDDAATGAKTSGATAPKTTAAQPGGAPIKLTIISQTTQQGGVGEPEVAAAARARVEAINAAGGIQGRPVELTACDSKQDPNATRACARQAVADGSVAVVGTTTTTEASVFPVLEQAHVPAIGTTPMTAAAGESKAAYCFNPGVAGDFLALVPALADAGAKKVSMVYPSNVAAVSAAAKAAFDQGVKKAGVEAGTPVGYTWGETQFDTPVAKVLEGGVDGVVAVAPGATLAPLVQTLRQQSADVRVATTSVSLTPDVIEALGAAADGISAVTLTQPATATQLKGIKLFNADMDAYAKGEARTDLAINAWAAVWAFERIAQQLPSITRASVTKAMEQLDGLDMGGIYPPLSARGDTAAFPGLGCAMNTKVVFAKVDGGKLVALHPGEFYDPVAG